MNSQDIIPSIAIDRLLTQRDRALAALQRIKAAVAEYEAIGAELELDGSSGYKFHEPLSHRDFHHHIDRAEWLERSAKSLDTALWAHLFDKSGLRKFMDALAREKWDKQIDTNDTPALTADAAEATFRQLYASRGDMFEQGVIGLYGSLSWEYKTNRPIAFGKRLILRHVRDCHGFSDHRTCDKIDDLMRALCILDGKPQPDHRQGAHTVLGGRALSNDAPPRWSTPYFDLRTFKNGNGHLTFTRPDLVDGFNRILHKHRPDALSPSPPDDHEGETRLARRP